MRKVTTEQLQNRVASVDQEVFAFRAQFDEKSPLDELVRSGAQQMLETAIEAEVTDLVLQHSDRRAEQGNRLGVRNGHLPPCEILTGAGGLEGRQPRVRDNNSEKEKRVSFSSSILPLYLRRNKSIDDLLPWLYLKGISTGDFQEALEARLGNDAKGIGPNVVVRLKEKWGRDYDEWNRRDLSGKKYVYLWADAIYANVRLEDEANQRPCMLVLMGATADGCKELLAVVDRYRESKQSWDELLMGLKKQGLTSAPMLAIGDGALGFWSAIREVFGEAREQRCWFHKTGNVLNRMPKSVKDKAKSGIHEIWMAATREDANKAFDTFLEKCILMPVSA